MPHNGKKTRVNGSFENTQQKPKVLKKVIGKQQTENGTENNEREPTNGKQNRTTYHNTIIHSDLSG